MGDLAVDVMKNMSLRNAMSSVGAEPPEDATTTSEEIAIQGSKRTTGECKLSSAVVGENRVGVLKEGNQDEPVVHPSITRSVPRRLTSEV